MNSEIKNYIINNFKEDEEKDIKDAILESINDNDEVTLPGLGVFFLLNWEASNGNDKDKIIKNIYKQIKKGT